MRNLGILLSGRARFALAALLMSTAVALMPGGDATAQQGQGQYLVEASTRLGKLIARANQDGYIFHDNSFSIGGGWLRQGQDNWVALYTIELQANRRYRLLAAGDYDARDVDLEVQNLNGKILAQDVGTEPEAVVNFTPSVTARYLIRVRLYDSDKNLPCLCLGIVMVQK